MEWRPAYAYALVFGLLAYLCWRLRVRYHGDLNSLLTLGAFGFGGLASALVLFAGGRILIAFSGLLILVALLRPEDFPYSRAALIGGAALFALAYALPGSPCPVCHYRRCRCYAQQR